MANTINLKILQWNIRSVRANKDDLINLIREKEPDIILLNETWLNPNFNFHLNSYNIVRQDRADGYGGVVSCFKKSIIFHTIKKFSSDNIQYIHCTIGDLNLINIYSNSGSAFDLAFLDSLIDKISNQKIIIMGDLNSHHPMWDKANVNKGGIIINDFIFKNDLIIKNDGSGTLLQSASNSVSAVDLTIVSSQLAIYSTWEVINDSGNSDHFPTLLSFQKINNQSLKSPFINPYSVRNFKKADWDLFCEKVLTHIVLSNSVINYQDLIDIINLAAGESIPPKRCGVPGKLGNVWWDDECSAFVERRRDALSLFNRYPTIDNFIYAKKIIAVTRKNLRIKKKKNLNYFVKLSVETPILPTYGTKS